MENKYTNIKVNTALSLIVHGSNEVGFQLAKTLLEQGGRVILVDKFDSNTKRLVTELKKLGEADFIDFHGLESLYKSINRIDYIFYLLNENDQEKNLTSKDFLEESNYLNQTLKSALKNNTKTSLITSIKLNKRLTETVSSLNVSAPSPYSTIELQKYCETLTAEYRDKSKLNVRILRLGTLLGEGIQNISDDVVNDLFKDSLQKGVLTIKGEGLDTHYLININDAVYGILKLTFADKTEGEVITLANNHEYTTLSIAYKLLEINGDIREIKFKDSDDNTPFSLANYTPATNAEKYGWQQNSTLEQSIVESLKAINP
ncbi:MAG TPA: NAD(P)-dependent oxidoreductase, partial [Candidatus Dojkabacteria bacterium]|nr:NAD(P)-dependent oxidoreductase [Candidatus Dojkabacteria bacterium]